MQFEESSLMSRIFTRAHGLVPVDLVHCGSDHLAAAQLLFGRSADYYDSAGYLAHLGVELLIKGWLLEVADQFEDTHCLDTLYSSLVTQHRVPRLSDGAAETLNMLDEYGELRYPDLRQPTEVGDDDWPRIDELTSVLLLTMPTSLLVELEKVQPGRKAGRVLMEKKKS